MKKILVVDDNISFLKQINALLEDQYELFLAKSGEMALKIGIQEKPDAVLLDIEMPGMDGFAVLAKLKNESWFGSTPVIFLTGNQDEATKTNALAAGAEDILTKPIDRDKLLNGIGNVMRSP